MVCLKHHLLRLSLSLERKLGLLSIDIRAVHSICISFDTANEFSLCLAISQVDYRTVHNLPAASYSSICALNMGETQLGGMCDCVLAVLHDLKHTRLSYFQFGNCEIVEVGNLIFCLFYMWINTLLSDPSGFDLSSITCESKSKKNLYAGSKKEKNERSMQSVHP